MFEVKTLLLKRLDMFTAINKNIKVLNIKKINFLELDNDMLVLFCRWTKIQLSVHK